MIAIKDMEMPEMPKSCSDCNMTTCKGKDEPWNYVCSINLKDIDFNETERAEHCPLVEIVTCKDCKYRGTREWNVLIWCKRQGEYQSKDSFCGYGKRRE